MNVSTNKFALGENGFSKFIDSYEEIVLFDVSGFYIRLYSKISHTYVFPTRVLIKSLNLNFISCKSPAIKLLNKMRYTVEKIASIF